MRASSKRTTLVVLILLLLVSALLWFGRHRKTEVPVQPTEIPQGTPPLLQPTSTPTSTPVPLPTATPKPKASASPTPEARKPVKPVVSMAPTPPPPVQLHKELIPKDIEIVRVYYAQQITGPGSIVEFDINGSGFNAEFEKMIAVESGSPQVNIKNLKLMTPNQIHGVLVIKSDTPTGAVFPQVLIQGKVVFRAPEPYAVIRPGEVLNLIFTEMGENGRSGRFRVFTNLTQDMYAVFSIQPSNSVIQISELAPNLPFQVDGTLNIGGAAGGAYGISVKLGEKTIWNKDGLIQVVQPNVGQSGLAQQIRATDGFHRPGDQARFLLYGSGFQPQDVNLLRVKLDSVDLVQSTMVFKSPGRMELTLVVPAEIAIGAHQLSILQGDNVLLKQEKAFAVVGKNWTRELKPEPALAPGGKGILKLTGRELDKDFIDSLQTEVDTEDLKVGKFTWVGPELATAEVSAGSGIQPGDYLIKLSSNRTPVIPQFGSIIKIQ